MLCCCTCSPPSRQVEEYFRSYARDAGLYPLIKVRGSRTGALSRQHRVGALKGSAAKQPGWQPQEAHPGLTPQCLVSSGKHTSPLPLPFPLHLPPPLPCSLAWLSRHSLPSLWRQERRRGPAAGLWSMLTWRPAGRQRSTVLAPRAGDSGGWIRLAGFAANLLGRLRRCCSTLSLVDPPPESTQPASWPHSH